MATISSPNLDVRRITTSSGTYGEVNYSYRIDWGSNDISENLWHAVHVVLWERDGSNKDYLHTRYNGGHVTVWRDSGNDEFISYINGRWLRPNGSSSTSVSGTRTLSTSTMHDEWGEEEFYLQVGAHPWSGGNVEAYSNEDAVNF